MKVSSFSLSLSMPLAKHFSRSPGFSFLRLRLSLSSYRSIVLFSDFQLMTVATHPLLDARTER